MKMLRTLLALGAILASVPAFAADRWPQSPNAGGTTINTSSLFTSRVLWDADGDGSTIQTCTAKDLPIPQCKVAGERIYPDTADDVNCAIQGCGYGQMSQTGKIILEDGVVYALFPCWNFGAWDADASTPASCPAAGINDPRNACQAGGTDTRFNSSSTDAAVYASCPVDADGKKMMSMSTLDWQGTIQGGGVDASPNDTSNLTTGGRNRGTTIAVDTSNTDVDWFLATTGFVRAIQLGRFDFGTPTTDPTHSNGGGTMVTGNSKGWGVFQGFSGAPYTMGSNEMRGKICVCDSATSCDGAASLASATDWVDGLLDGDIVTVPLLVSAATTITAPVDLVVNGAGTTFVQGSCPAGAKEMPFGAIGTSAQAQELPWGMLTEDYGARIVHARTSSRAARATLRDVTIEPQDWYGEIGGDCAKIPNWTVTADSTDRDGGGPDPVRDLDCDTNPLVGLFGNGSNTLNNVMVKNWHHFAIDGGPHPGKSRMDRVQFWYGKGGAFADDSFSWEWYDTEIHNTVSTGILLGGFFSNTRYERLDIINSSFSSIGSLGYGNEGISFRDVKLIGSQFRNAFAFTCGAKNNWIQGVKAYGRSTLGEGVVHPLIDLTCATILTNTNFCDTSGLMQDRGAGAGDFWCDGSISENVIKDISEYPPGGDADSRNSIASVDTATEFFTTSNALQWYECQLLNVNTTATCDGGSCITNWYVKAPNYATNEFQISSSCNGAASNLAGAVGGSDFARANAGFSINQSRLAQSLVRINATAGQEAAIRNNVFDGLRIPTTIAMSECRSAGVGCDDENPLATLVQVTAGTEPVLGYNTLQNSSIDGGALVGACQATAVGVVCPDVENLRSFSTMPGSGNILGGKSPMRANANPYQGRWSEMVFCGDLPAVADATWWLPPVSSEAAYAAVVDERVQRMMRPQTCAARLGVTEDAAVVATVDEPFSALLDPPLELMDMSCYTTGDVAGNITFTLQNAGVAVAAFACTMTAGTSFESYCSVAPVVALSTSPTTIAANAAVAIQSNTASGDNSGNDAWCVVRTRPRW